jgi:hypothetical protein
MAITKADIIDAIDEVIQALADYEGRTGRQVELIIEADCAASLRASETGPDGELAGFAEVARFQCFEDLWTYLHMAEAA